MDGISIAFPICQQVRQRLDKCGRSGEPLLYNPATPNTVICVGTLGVVLPVITRGQKRSKELRHDADFVTPAIAFRYIYTPPLVVEREDLVDSPEHGLRDTDVRQCCDV